MSMGERVIGCLTFRSAANARVEQEDHLDDEDSYWVRGHRLVRSLRTLANRLGPFQCMETAIGELLALSQRRGP
jgi:hypothetical protein